MNKIGSTRIITVNKNKFSKSGLLFLEDEKLFRRAQMKIILNEDDVKELTSWDEELLKNHKDDKYTLVKFNAPYHDCCYVKLLLEYDKENKTSIDKVKTLVFDKNRKERKDLTLNDLNELLKKSNSYKVTLKAQSLFNWNKKTGIKYTVTRIEL